MRCFTFTMIKSAGLTAMLAAWASTTGCHEPMTRTNAPPQGHTDYKNELRENYVHMTDNAMLADMSMSPGHFVPHSSELNSLGVARLRRYGEIMSTYGGTLHYDGPADGDLRPARVAQIETFLLAMGLDPNEFDVEEGIAGGEGMRAEESMAAREASSITEESASGDSGGGGLGAMLGQLGGGGGGSQ
jgi:hypothetical protein